LTPHDLHPGWDSSEFIAEIVRRLIDILPVDDTHGFILVKQPTRPSGHRFSFIIARLGFSFVNTTDVMEAFDAFLQFRYYNLTAPSLRWVMMDPPDAMTGQEYRLLKEHVSGFKMPYELMELKTHTLYNRDVGALGGRLGAEFVLTWKAPRLILFPHHLQPDNVGLKRLMRLDLDQRTEFVQAPSFFESCANIFWSMWGP
jgi:hypothetical protein